MVEVLNSLTLKLTRIKLHKEQFEKSIISEYAWKQYTNQTLSFYTKRKTTRYEKAEYIMILLIENEFDEHMSTVLSFLVVDD